MSVQLHTYCEARLGRWKLWNDWGSDGKPKAVCSWYGPMVIDPNVEQIGRPTSVCPVDVTEAEETNRCIMALEPDLRDTIFQVYLYGGTVAQQARALGLRRRQSVYERLERAYRHLLGYFNDAAAGVALPATKPRIRAELVELRTLSLKIA
jgi:hypothetical protein